MSEAGIRAAGSGMTSGAVGAMGTAGTAGKKTGLDWWSDRAWIKFGCVVSFVMMVAILVNWHEWGTGVKVLAAVAVLIPLHVVEEWVFPGGFHYQYNTALYGSDVPNAYPMCRLSDMITNLMATFLYIGLAIVALCNGGHVNPGMLMGTVAFAALEFGMHTYMGVRMYLRFKGAGKTTIYGPGSITAYFGFVPLGAISLWCLNGATITGLDWCICAGILAFIAVVCILIPENIIKRKDTPYCFASAGYFERFM